MTQIDPEEPFVLPGFGTYTFRTFAQKLAAGALPPRPYYDLFGQTHIVTLSIAEARRLVLLPEYQTSGR
jgi:hypothetical protein